ncbi:MAG TPA: fibronectin type III domain-containing protein [Tepiditoga sp.]|nr:fibronectin type III domain-containing protein [Tepiditoga sp.]
MKKLFILLNFFIIIILFTGCIARSENNTLKQDDLKFVLKNQEVSVITSENIYGTEVIFNGNFSKEDFEIPSDLFFIFKNENGKTLIAVAKSEKIKKGREIFKIKNTDTIKNLIFNVKTEKQIDYRNKRDILPDGIYIPGKNFNSSDDDFLIVHGKNIHGLAGISLSIEYDSDLFTVDSTKGNNGVEMLGKMSGELSIVKLNDGKIEISTVFSSSKDIYDEDVYKVYIKTKNTDNDFYLNVFGEARDSEMKILEPLPVFSAGKFSVSGKKLLGDFNGDFVSDLKDFIMFVNHFDNENYEKIYDIYPADIGSGIWKDIYCKAYPDNQIKLADFGIFANNYDIRTPESILQKPGFAKSEVKSSTEIKLFWTDNSSDENGFKVERKENDSSWKEIADLPQNSAEFTDTFLNPDTFYAYRVYCYNEKGISDYTESLPVKTYEKSVKAPSEFTYDNLGNAFLLKWKDNSLNEKGFKVERKSNNSEWSVIADLSENTVEFRDETLVSGETYFYRIYGYNEFGNSEYSEEISVKYLKETKIAVGYTEIESESYGDIYIYSENIIKMGGSSVTFEYDSNYFEIDSSKGNNGVSVLNSYLNGMTIVKSAEGKIKIDTAFQSSFKNENKENIYIIHVISKKMTGETNVNLSGYAYDKELNSLEIKYSGNIITIK